MEPLISVIIPIYKAEKYIEKCVNGVQKQTYRNLEIILVNDGSPDHSGKICDELASRDNRIKVIHKENGGAASARNAGLDIMTGAYVTFVDADDYMKENYLEVLYRTLTDNNAQVSICSFETVDEEGNKVTIDNLHAEKDAEVANTGEQKRAELLTGNDIILQDLQGHWEHVAPWGKLFEANLYKEIRYPHWIAYEDEQVFIQVFDKVKTVALGYEKLYYYVQHSGSLMNSAYSEKHRMTYLKMWKERLAFYQDGKTAHAELLQQVKQAYVAWNVLYLSLHVDRMTKEQEKEHKKEICKYFWSLFKKPHLFSFAYSFKMAIKCGMILINTNILRKRYVG